MFDEFGAQPDDPSGASTEDAAVDRGLTAAPDPQAPPTDAQPSAQPAEQRVAAPTDMGTATEQRALTAKDAAPALAPETPAPPDLGSEAAPVDTGAAAGSDAGAAAAVDADADASRPTPSPPPPPPVTLNSGVADPTALTRRRRAIEFLRPLPLVLGAGLLLNLGANTSKVGLAEADRTHGLAAVLKEHELRADPADIHFVDAAPGVLTARSETPRAVVRASKADAPADIYLVETVLAPNGRVRSIAGIYNLTDTSAADETRLVVGGERAAWTIGGGGKTYSVHMVDLRGAELAESKAWSRTKRWQHRMTNLQKTGSERGVVKRSFKLDPAAQDLQLAYNANALLISADGNDIRIPTEDGSKITGQRFLREVKHHTARPGNLVTWAVDRVRQSPWMTDDQMQLIKAVAFKGLDVAEQFVGTVTGDDGSDRVAEEMGSMFAAPAVEYTDPETGWPPPPMEPMISPALKDEGKWRPMDKDPYIRANPGVPSAFVTGFIRTDRKRRYTQIWVTLWDPRQVELHTMSGTIEPKSATGETGPGLIPRKPEVMERLVGGLNGGFQASHGEFGMMAESIVYLPPKPYAATVAELDDGSTGFGTWPGNDDVPDNIIGFRQNMTPLVMDGKINPYRRNWWGGVPPGWKDEARTVRSAICLTKEGFIGYLYGASIDADHMAFAMQRARCSYGIHLDMNAGHTGLEFYHAAPAGKVPDVGHRMDRQWEARGKVSEMPGYEFIGRRMIRYMGLMNFPRYINREARDFFYLTLRHVLPGENLSAPLDAKEGKWKVKGLPQHGWPYAVATTSLRPAKDRPDAKVRVLKIDPRMVRLGAAADDKPIVAFQKAARSGSVTLWLDRGRCTIGDKAPSSSARAVIKGETSGTAVAAVGAGGRDGMLLYAEVATDRRGTADAALLTAMLKGAGAKQIMLLPTSAAPALGGDRDLAGHPVTKVRGAPVLARAAAPGARRIFKDTPVVEPKVWYPLQSKRIRYFRKRKKAPVDTGGEESAGGGDAATPPAPASSP